MIAEIVERVIDRLRPAITEALEQSAEEQRSAVAQVLGLEAASTPAPAKKTRKYKTRDSNQLRLVALLESMSFTSAELMREFSIDLNGLHNLVYRTRQGGKKKGWTIKSSTQNGLATYSLVKGKKK